MKERPLTLEQTREMDQLTKRALYSAITGKPSHDPSMGLDVHNFEIRPDQIGLAYEAIQKFRKLYGAPKTPSGIDPLVDYYRPDLKRIDSAVESGDVVAFNEAVKGLLMSIIVE